MKIQAIKTNYEYLKANIAGKRKIENKKSSRVPTQAVFDYLSFQGIDKRPETSLWGMKTPAELNIILDNEKFTKAFINRIINRPRDSRAITYKIFEILGGITELKEWCYKPDGYYDKYAKYIEKAVETAESPDDLLKISPNWSYWAMTNKFGNDFMIGKVPEVFGSKKEYQKLVQGVLKGKEDVKFPYREMHGGESGKRTFMIGTGDKKYVLKVHNDYLLYSDKLRKLVEEESWLKDTFIKTYKENEAMRSDSCYINAMIDSYLNLNKCENSLKIHCFDAKTQSVIYDFAEGENYEEPLDVVSINKVIPDLNNLGLIYNDVSSDNLKVNDGKITIIDSGETTFYDSLKPVVSGYQFELPNWAGRSISSITTNLFVY